MNKSLSFRNLVIIGSIAVVAIFAGQLFLDTGAQAAVPSDFGFREGDLISASGSSDPDVYILNEHGFKRLVLSPSVFSFYGHLSFNNIKQVPPSTRDAFTTANLYRNCEAGDQKVYALEITAEDGGVLHWVNMSGSQAVSQDPNFFKKVFCINNREFSFYPKGADYTSVSQIPPYSRGIIPTPTPTVSPTPTPSPTASPTVPSGAPATGMGGY